MSQAFYPNYDSSAAPAVSIEHLRSMDTGEIMSYAVTADEDPENAADAFSATNVHFSSTASSLGELIAGVDNKNIVIYGVTLATNAETPFAINLFPDGYDFDLFTGVCNVAGPMFIDFAQPLVLPKGAALNLLCYTKNAINIVNIRYGIHNVAGK